MNTEKLGPSQEENNMEQAKEMRDKVCLILNWCTEDETHTRTSYAIYGVYDHLELSNGYGVSIQIKGSVRSELVFEYHNEDFLYLPGMWEDELDAWYAKALKASYDPVIEALLKQRETQKGTE